MKQTRRQPVFGRLRGVHFVGIGGIGMSSIAEVLLRRGYQISGSDVKKSDVTDHLESLGAAVYEGHAADQIGEAEVVVFSSAVRPMDNPECIAAAQRRIPVLSRAEMLGELMRMQYGVGIAGTHGKTTTTTMTGMIVREGGFDPTIIVGGKVEAFGSNAVAGEGDVIVIEADEYDRTFLRLTPSLAVITSLEADHLDIYRDLDDLRGAFAQYANRVPFFGAAIVCLDEPNVQSIIGQIERRLVTYGLARQADVRAEDVRPEGTTTRFLVFDGPERLGTITLHVPGLHNVRNALAAIAVGLELDIPFEAIARALDQFRGVQRRFQQLGEKGGIRVVDDYAHHPTEVAATLEAASDAFPDRRLVAVFQPHLYSRTRDLLHEFAQSFIDADVLVLTDIYPAREEPIEGIDGQLLADMAQRYGHRAVQYVADKEALPAHLASVTRPGDVVITMGAGDVWKYGKDFFDQIEEEAR